jgi:hypothetical protein
MHASDLPFPKEPHALKQMARTLLDQAPDAGLPLVVAGEWIASPLWEGWGEALAARGMDRETFGRVVAGYGNALRGGWPRPPRPRRARRKIHGEPLWTASTWRRTTR